MNAKVHGVENVENGSLVKSWYEMEGSRNVPYATTTKIKESRFDFGPFLLYRTASTTLVSTS